MPCVRGGGAWWTRQREKRKGDLEAKQSASTVTWFRVGSLQFLTALFLAAALLAFVDFAFFFFEMWTIQKA